MSSENCHINIVRLLIDSWAKINIKYRKKKALNYAYEEKHNDVLKLLRAAGGE